MSNKSFGDTRRGYERANEGHCFAKHGTRLVGILLKMKQSSIFSFAAKGELKPGTPVVDLFCGVRLVQLKHYIRKLNHVFVCR